MSNTNTPAEPQKPAEVTPPAPGAVQNPEVIQVSAKEFSELKATVNRLNAQMRAGRKAEPQNPQNPAPTPQKPEPLIPAKDVKDPRVDQLLEKNARNARAAAFAQAINSVGVTGDDADLLQSAVEGKYGSRIKVDAESDQVFFEDEDGSHKTVTELVQFVHGKHKDRFSPAKKTVNANGAAGQGGSANGGTNPYAKLTYPEIMKAVNRGDKQASEFVTQNNEEFQAKKQQHFATKN